MKVVFLGTGEAFDENNPNNSSLVISEKTNLLLDCGFTTPYQLWKYNNDQNLLDAVYITHLHGDHCFGLPALLMRMWEDGRTKPFTVICQEDISLKILEMAYPKFLEKFQYKVRFEKAEIGKGIEFNDLKLSFAKSDHSTKESIAIKIENNVKCLALTHINRNARQEVINKCSTSNVEHNVKVIIPEPFDEFTV